MLIPISSVRHVPYIRARGSVAKALTSAVGRHDSAGFSLDEFENIATDSCSSACPPQVPKGFFIDPREPILPMPVAANWKPIERRPKADEDDQDSTSCRDYSTSTDDPVIDDGGEDTCTEKTSSEQKAVDEHKRKVLSKIGDKTSQASQ